MTPRLMHDNPEVFTDPTTFDPSRWLTLEERDGHMVRPARHTDARTMDRSWRPFGGGPRNCIGINLAYAMLNQLLVATVRRFDFEITDTVRERDVDLVRDHFVGLAARGSKGTKVLVLSDAAETTFQEKAT